jgi:hypothetical protein
LGGKYYKWKIKKGDHVREKGKQGKKNEESGKRENWEV